MQNYSKVAQSCPTVWDPMDCSLSGFSVHGIFQARVLGGLPFPSPGAFPTHESNPGLPHCRQTLYHLSHQGSPFIQNTDHKGTCRKCTCIIRAHNFPSKTACRETDRNTHIVAAVQLPSRVQLCATPWTVAPRPPCLSLSPRVCSESCPLSLTICPLPSPSPPAFNLSQH